MRWYLLRDRRHEGPFSKEEIAEGVKAGRIDPQTYLLPEQAIKDQSSFAYISVADVLGPEFLFDHKKKQETAAQSNPAAAYKVGQGVPVAPPSKETLISEFEEGLESTQLVRLQRSKDQANEGPRAEYSPGQFSSFTSTPETPNRMPVIIGAVVLVVLALGSVAYNFFGSGITTEAPSVAVESKGGGERADRPARPSAVRPTKNRLPSGRIQLPAATPRDEEDSASSFERLNSEETAEPVRERRKRKAPKGDSEVTEESAEASSDTESFDEEEYVEEDESVEVEDEADI